MISTASTIAKVVWFTSSCLEDWLLALVLPTMLGDVTKPENSISRKYFKFYQHLGL